MRIIKNLLWTILLSLVLVLATFIHNAIEDFRHPTCNLQGRVVKLADGDSITVLDEDEVQHKIRLSGIDTPERGQAFGKAAKAFLSEKMANKTVCVGWSKKDRYQRLVGVVKLGDEDINLSIVKAGLAWHYKAYQDEQTSTDQRAYAKAEIQARKKRLGLWKDKDPVAPWDWRRNQRQ
ncbi:nuclease [Leucothrix sargassi]|nr:nuclease [Leucothrix sargassi]